MPQSLVKNYIHIVFSTKHRQAFIDKPIKEELFSYMGGICKNLESNPVIVGGHVDHIHILCMLSRKIPLMNLIEELKVHSSKWIKTKGIRYKNFYWQKGYAGFSVYPPEIHIVEKYIATQENHHNKKSFKEEYRGFLNDLNIDFDERYVWD
ncbi:MAG: transposase [Bacteroidales bacterium]|nr:transposase [Bacteroidales bacterium]MCF8390599.1 transposase [Bacteroidales bacterium]